VRKGPLFAREAGSGRISYSREERRTINRQRCAGSADSLEIRLRVLDEAHVADCGYDDELAAGDPVVQGPGRARGRRAVAFPDDQERRLAHTSELRHVVELAVALSCEVAEHFGCADRVVAVARRRLAGEMERHLGAHELPQALLGGNGLLVLPGLRDRRAFLPQLLE